MRARYPASSTESRSPGFGVALTLGALVARNVLARRPKRALRDEAPEAELAEAA